MDLQLEYVVLIITNIAEEMSSVNTGFALKSISRQPLLSITSLNTSQITVETHLASE